eukprot:990331-Prorocentrum_minimum.AAC.2
MTETLGTPFLSGDGGVHPHQRLGGAAAARVQQGGDGHQGRAHQPHQRGGERHQARQVQRLGGALQAAHQRRPHQGGTIPPPDPLQTPGILHYSSGSEVYGLLDLTNKSPPDPWECWESWMFTTSCRALLLPLAHSAAPPVLMDKLV